MKPTVYAGFLPVLPPDHDGEVPGGARESVIAAPIDRFRPLVKTLRLAASLRAIQQAT
jgi:hypothetical protein